MYYRTSREKRNHAAILYHLLLSDTKNLQRFLELVGHKPTKGLEELEVYYEYAWLRDHWYGMKRDNEAKKKYLLGLLPESLRSTLEPMDPLEWNRFFAAQPVPSPKRFQSPARWSPGTMPNGIDRATFARISRLKWCFNVKPDLVIITGERQAVCIETKFDSLQTSYQEPNPAYPELEPVTELQCHRYMFEHLMDDGPWEVSYVLLSKKKTESEEFTGITWQEVFDRMDASNSHPFVSRWLKENRAIQAADGVGSAG
jgi:hypothetical protein